MLLYRDDVPEKRPAFDQIQARLYALCDSDVEVENLGVRAEELATVYAASSCPPDRPRPPLPGEGDA